MDPLLLETLLEYPTQLFVRGRRFVARAVGGPRADGLWEGYLAFDSDAALLQTERETTQPNRTDLVYWAHGLTPVYLEGALERALDADNLE